MRRGLLALLLVSAWSGAAFGKSKVAVFGIEPIDTGDAKSRQKTGALAKTLTRALRDRVATIDVGYEIAPNSSKDLAELKLLSDCLDEGPDCMAAIGASFSAELIIYGHIERQRDGYLVTVQSLSVTSPRKPPPFSAKRTVPFAAATDEAMKKIAEETLIVAGGETLLLVEVNAPGGMVTVNGIPKGALMNGRLTVKGVTPGPAVVVVTAPGYESYEQKIDVKPGGATKMSVELVKASSARTAPPAAIPTGEPVAERPGGTARVLFWTSLVATGAGVAAFTITGLKVKSIEKEQDAAIAAWGDGFRVNGVQFPGDACAEARNDGFQKLIDICDRGKSMSTVTNVLIGVTAAAAVATAFFGWKGYLSSSSNDERHAARSRPPRVVFSPEIYRTGGGVGALVQF